MHFSLLTFTMLAAMGKLGVAGPSATFFSGDFFLSSVPSGHEGSMADRVPDDRCEMTNFEATDEKYNMDKIGSKCLAFEPDRKALKVSGAKSDNGDNKPYCLFLSEGGYCDGETIQMDMQGKST